MINDKCSRLYMNPFKAVQIDRNVHWVGAIDWKIRDFHGYATHNGTTYNAFLITADKTVLIDTVKFPFRDEMLSRITSVINPQKIDIVVSLHSEMDHSGCLPDIMEIAQPEKVIASRMGAKALADHGLISEEITAVRDGETINIGGKNLTFIETRMLHWPDSMFAHLKEDNILFSQDAFGMHLAASRRFDDELDLSLLKYEAAKYYANILTPYSPLVIKLLDRVGEMGLSPRMILPDHGPVWRRNVNVILELYAEWAQLKPGLKAVIAYDTMWESTAKMAAAVAEGAVSARVEVKVMPLRGSHRSDVATELLDAGAFIVGSPTINNNMFPTVADLLTYIRGLRRAGLIGAAFGSYGWAGEAVKQIEDELKGMKVEIAAEAVKAKYVPTHEDLDKCFAMGYQIAEKLKQR